MERFRIYSTIVFLGLMITANAATTATTDATTTTTAATTTTTGATTTTADATTTTTGSTTTSIQTTSAAVNSNDTKSSSNDTSLTTTMQPANVTQLSPDHTTSNSSIMDSTAVSMNTTTTSMSSKTPISTTSTTTSMAASTTMSTSTTVSPSSTKMTGSTKGAGPTSSGASAQAEESDFGKHGFVAFGITFAIAVILAIILIVMLVQKKQKSGVYMTAEANSPRREGIPMAMPMNDGGLDHVQTIDLDKGDTERQVGNGTGLSSFTVENEEQKNTANTSSFGKQEDSGSVNNLLQAETSDKEVSDDEEGPAEVVGLKMEPSTGASVESLEKLKETDKLMDNADNRSSSLSTDDNLPPPSLSGSESGEV